MIVNKVWDFMDHSITRSSPSQKSDYHDYIPDLKKDFHNRCGYCNTSEMTVGTRGFHVDHFVPRKYFSGVLDELDTYYPNLIWSCPRCNLVKSSKFSGKIDLSCNNDMLLDPSKINFNQIFYRNVMGGIESTSKDGISTIKTIDLVNPLYNILFLSDKLEVIFNKMDKIINRQENSTEKDVFSCISYELNKLQQMIKAYY